MFVSFEDAYGFRGSDPRLYYLNPWEFTKWWKREALRLPSSYRNKGEELKTKWTAEGLKYMADISDDPSAPAPEPGLHYTVVDPGPNGSYVPFPDNEATSNLRHRFVLVRRSRPVVPQPEATPLPKARMAADERARILSVYLRPWVLDRSHSSPHVPHLADLDVVVSTALSEAASRRRMSKKQHPWSCETWRQRGWTIGPNMLCRNTLRS